MSALTRIMLVDDHSLCRSGLTELLEHRGGLKVVGARAHDRQCRGLRAREHQPLLKHGLVDQPEVSAQCPLQTLWLVLVH